MYNDILWRVASSSSLLLFVRSSRSTPSRLSLFRMAVEACFMFLLFSPSYHHTMLVKHVRHSRDCVCQQYLPWRLIVVYSYCIEGTVSFHGRCPNSSTSCTPADDHATASPIGLMISVIVWMVGWPDITIAKAREVYYNITSFCASPHWLTSVAGIVLSALQSMRITFM